MRMSGTFFCTATATHSSPVTPTAVRLHELIALNAYSAKPHSPVHSSQREEEGQPNRLGRGVPPARRW